MVITRIFNSNIAFFLPLAKEGREKKEESPAEKSMRLFLQFSVPDTTSNK
jgi:hypothetical protein